LVIHGVSGVGGAGLLAGVATPALLAALLLLKTIHCHQPLRLLLAGCCLPAAGCAAALLYLVVSDDRKP
jgi:hypothetical protein